jgi:hypothetical protein
VDFAYRIYNFQINNFRRNEYYMRVQISKWYPRKSEGVRLVICLSVSVFLRVPIFCRYHHRYHNFDSRYRQVQNILDGNYVLLFITIIFLDEGGISGIFIYTRCCMFSPPLISFKRQTSKHSKYTVLWFYPLFSH